MIRSNNIRRISSDIDETVDEALDAGAELIAISARSRAPVDTGTLRDSIRVREIDDGRAIEATAFYANMVEHGTVNAGPRPFLVPAFEEHQDLIERRIREAMQRMVDRGGHF